LLDAAVLVKSNRNLPFSRNRINVAVDDVINSVPSKELSSFLDFCSFLNLSQAALFLFFVWLLFKINFTDGPKRRTLQIEFFGHLNTPTGRLIILTLLTSFLDFTWRFLPVCILNCTYK
jgi:hypothetical protein